MNDDDAIWTLEHDFWLTGVEHYEHYLDPACLMAFPPPVGVMDRDAVVESLRDAPRWAGVGITGQTTTAPPGRSR